MSKKILFIGHSSKLGGAQKVLANIINILSSEKNDLECHVVCPRFQSENFENLIERRKNVFLKKILYRSNSSNTIKHFIGTLFNIPALFYFYFFVKFNKINLLYINSSTNLMGIILSSITNVPTILHVHEQNNSSLKILPDYIKFFYKYFFIRNNIFKILFPSNMTKYSWEKYLNIVISNGNKLYAPVITETFQRVNREEVFVIGFVGSLYHEKNIFTLLCAFVNFLKQHPSKNIILKVIGDGPLREDILTFSRNNNLFDKIQVITNLNLHSHIYKDLSVLVQPSIMESWSLVAAEALTYNIPLIISNQSGITEVLVDKKDSLFFNPLNVDELLNCLNLLINDKDFYQSIANSGTKNIRSLNLNHLFEQEILHII